MTGGDAAAPVLMRGAGGKAGMAPFVGRPSLSEPAACRVDVPGSPPTLAARHDGLSFSARDIADAPFATLADTVASRSARAERAVTSQQPIGARQDMRRILWARGFLVPRPYSPDLNPGEQPFSKLKHLLRAASPRTVEDSWHKVGQLLDLASPNECNNHLTDSHGDSN